MQYHNSQHLAPRIRKSFLPVAFQEMDRPEASVFPDLISEQLHVSIEPCPNTVSGIQRRVCREYNISLEAMISYRRHKDVVKARQVAMARCVDYTDRTLVQIAKLFNRDHTTVIHAHKKYGERV